jgi:formylmethanofuran dehydrogenase subunit D
MHTKLTSHNKYNSKILLNKKYWKELGFKENDKVNISKLEDGKIVVERINSSIIVVDN